MQLTRFRKRSIRLTMTLIIWVGLIPLEVEGDEPGDSTNAKAVVPETIVDTILAPQNGLYNWSYRDSLIAAVFVQDSLVFCGLDGSVKYGWLEDTEPEDAVYVLPGDSLFAYVHNRYVSSESWLKRLILRLYAFLSGSKSEISIRFLRSNESVCNQRFWGMLVNYDYCPESGLLALLSYYDGPFLQVIDVARDTILFEELVPSTSANAEVLLDEDRLYVIDLMRVREYSVPANRRILHFQTHDFGMGMIHAEQTRAAFRVNGRKRMIVYNEMFDSVFGPIQFVKDTQMVQPINEYLAAHSLSGLRFYDLPTKQMYICTTDRIIAADFQERQIHVFPMNRCCGWDGISWAAPVERDRFLVGIDWEYPSTYAVCIFDNNQCPSIEIQGLGRQ